MTWLYFLNAGVLQWFFVRLARVVDVETGKQQGWRLLRWVVPCTGWSTSYRYVGNG